MTKSPSQKLAFAKMHSTVFFFLVTSAYILQVASGWSYFRSVDNGVKVEKNKVTSGEGGRRLGWLSDMLAKAAKEARKNSSAPTKLPTKSPTQIPTAIDTPSPVSSPTKNPTMSPTTKSPTNELDEVPTISPTKFPTKSPTRSPITLENTCLTEPTDKYRTCFQRAVDPQNNLTEDKILRDNYNLGAIMFERGINISSPSASTYLAPYTEPYVMPDEELTNGTVYFSLVTDGVKNLTCDDQIELEEVTLKWVKVSLERNNIPLLLVISSFYSMRMIP